MNNTKTQVLIDRWTHLNNFLFTGVFILYHVTTIEINWLIGIGLFSFLIYWLLNRAGLSKMKPFAGYANWITLFRLLLISVTLVFTDQLLDRFIFILVFSAVIFDGLDGWIARKTKQESVFGAHFDMECDAFYVAMMTLVLYERAMFGQWLLIVGFLRYLFGTFLYLMQWHKLSSLRLRWGPTIAGIFFVALTTPFVLPASIYHPTIIISGSLISFSFAVSLISIMRKLIKQPNE
ncbi:MAG: hypothetical protein GVY19_08920 [Bacteroidetes bacterium]|jgi:phosphatidylglycerophosphate synthase|nr:hypothetical protein [Bacteroidota bacterium]